MKAIVAGLVAAISLFTMAGRGARAAPPDASFTVDARVALGAYQGLVEEHLDGVLSGLKGLAATDSVRSGDWNRMKAALGQYAASVPTGTVLWFARPDGSYYTATAGLTDKSLRDRRYFSELLAGRDVLGALVVSKTAGNSDVIVATPVRRDRTVIGALGMSISLEKLAARVDGALRLPSDIIFYALDDKGQTALHRESDLLMQFPTELGDASLKAAVKEMLSKPEGAETYMFRGAQKTVVFRKSALTGWVFVLGMTH